jgi:sulfopyruvate decarboxylase alpha subunit
MREGGAAVAASTATAQIVERLAECQVRLVASLPDNWIADLITAVDEDERFLHVRVNREESAIGLCSGAFFGGVRAVVLMGASGLTTCLYALTKINYSYQIPLLILVTLRGAIGDRAPYHVSNGLYLLPMLDAISLPYTIVERPEQFSVIPTAFTHSRTINRPVVVAFTRDVLRGGS